MYRGMCQPGCKGGEKEDTLYMLSIDANMWIVAVDKYMFCLSNKLNLKG